MKGDNRSFWQRMSLIYTKFMSGADPTYAALCEMIRPQLGSDMEVLELAVARDKLIEVNTGAISRGWRKRPYPNQYLLETILEEGGEVLLSSDSHHQDNLDFFFDESVELLKEAGFDHLNVFNGRHFDKIYFD